MEDAAWTNRIDNSWASTEEGRDRRLAALLWQWTYDPSRQLEDGQTVVKHIECVADWVLRTSFSYSTLERGLVPDGVISLFIQKMSDTAFLLFGAAYWFGKKAGGIAPFEMELHFPKRDCIDFERMIVRFGNVLPCGQLKCEWPRKSSHQYTFVNELIENRPRQNAQWAMAIELTPPASACVNGT